MAKVRVGIIGLGNIGQHHAQYLMAGAIQDAELVAVANPSPGKLEKYRSLKNCADGGDLLRAGQVDAVIIATPHYQHTRLGVEAFERGVHVMVEKPISAHKADAERLIEAHRRNPRLVFGAMFQLRTEPRYQRIRERLQSGELGKVVRWNWIITDWYRTEAYYASSAWRATWKGEGGGVLINQCLHNLDMVQWLLGMPARVRGFCQLGRFHNIEVEDNVTAYLEYAGGATATFVSTTGEAPGSNRFEIVGTLGKLILENDRLTFTRNDADMLEFGRTAKLGFTKPQSSTAELPFVNAANPHAIVMQNFINAITKGERLIAPGADGIHSVELANAILYSSLLERTLELPMDGAAYEQKLGELAAGSKIQKQVVQAASEDFSSSFKR